MDDFRSSSPDLILFCKLFAVWLFFVKVAVDLQQHYFKLVLSSYGYHLSMLSSNFVLTNTTDTVPLRILICSLAGVI